MRNIFKLASRFKRKLAEEGEEEAPKTVVDPDIPWGMQEENKLEMEPSLRYSEEDNEDGFHISQDQAEKVYHALLGYVLGKKMGIDAIATEELLDYFAAKTGWPTLAEAKKREQQRWMLE